MAEKRKVFKDMSYKHLEKLNPFIEMPKMMLSEVNAINDLIDRNTAKAIVRKDNAYNDNGYIDYCPICDKMLSDGWEFCSRCGQRLDRKNVEF